MCMVIIYTGGKDENERAVAKEIETLIKNRAINSLIDFVHIYFPLSTSILTCPSQFFLFIRALITISDRQCFCILQICENCTLAFSIWVLLII